jgi:exo-beta-1,3-glucanase (GH17 family)
MALGTTEPRDPSTRLRLAQDDTPVISSVATPSFRPCSVRHSERSRGIPPWHSGTRNQGILRLALGLAQDDGTGEAQDDSKKNLDKLFKIYKNTIFTF